MATAIVLPELGAETPVQIGCWLVEEGESVTLGDRMVEVRTRGMTFDVAAPVNGVLSHIEKPIDSVLQTGDVLGWIEPSS